MNLSRVGVSPENRDAFKWVAQNTPTDSTFLIMTGDTELFCDPVQEWFPMLSGRMSATTIQGHEWSRNGHFLEWTASLQDLQQCMEAASPMACITASTWAADIQYDYVYVAMSATVKQFCRATGVEIRGQGLLAGLSDREDFQLVHRTENVAIFKKVVE